MKMSMVNFLIARFSISFHLSFFCITVVCWLVGVHSLEVWFDLAFRALGVSSVVDHCVDHYHLLYLT